jgi:hypothetical protein
MQFEVTEVAFTASFVKEMKVWTPRFPGHSFNTTAVLCSVHCYLLSRSDVMLAWRGA